MIYYQAYCKDDSFESSLFVNKANAYKSAYYHLKQNPAHSVSVRRILVEGYKVESEEPVK